jgi:hypothetical protein
MNKTKFKLFASVVLLSGSVLYTCGAQPFFPQTTEGMKEERNIPYIENGHPNQVLDLYLPDQPSDKPLPLMIWIHGGAWMAGSQANPPMLYLVKEGFAVAFDNVRIEELSHDGNSVKFRLVNPTKFAADVSVLVESAQAVKQTVGSFVLKPLPVVHLDAGASTTLEYTY